jgi:hypothetical protein
VVFFPKKVRSSKKRVKPRLIFEHYYKGLWWQLGIASLAAHFSFITIRKKNYAF